MVNWSMYELLFLPAFLNGGPRPTGGPQRAAGGSEMAGQHSYLKLPDNVLITFKFLT